MKLVIFEDGTYENFYPIALSRPVFELKNGFCSLADKVRRQFPSAAVGYFCRDYLAETVKSRVDGPVNDIGFLKGDDLLLVNARLVCNECRLPTEGESVLAVKGDDVVYLRLLAKDWPLTLPIADLDSLLQWARQQVRMVKADDAPLAQYIWDLMLTNAEGLAADFEAADRYGIEGVVEEPNAIRGPKDQVYVAPGATIHPFVCIDATAGPVYIDADVEVHPFTRIEGPAYVGPKSILLGTKMREGCTIGPVCRVGGEVEESIIHGYSNKYHDGFLGHAYVGEWVNLGALTTNSDLKNDYSTVEVMLDGRKIDTGSTKVGSIIGDHTKTSIGTLFNTGAVCGAMCLLMATGQPLPKYIPSFAWFINGVVTKGFGKGSLYRTAKTSMARRKKQWTDAEQAMWDKIFEITAPQRDEAIKRGRREMVARRR